MTRATEERRLRGGKEDVSKAPGARPRASTGKQQPVQQNGSKRKLQDDIAQAGSRLKRTKVSARKSSAAKDPYVKDTNQALTGSLVPSHIDIPDELQMDFTAQPKPVPPKSRKATTAPTFKSPPIITSRVGTLARTRQMREALSKRNEGHQDDIFETAAVALSGTQVPDITHTPAAPARMMSSVLTPASASRLAGSPEILKPFDPKEKEAYVHVLKKRRLEAARRAKVNAAISKPRTGKKGVSADQDLAGALAGRRPDLFHNGFDINSDEEGSDSDMVVATVSESE